MVKAFIDIENGTTFNGEKPFVFWFDEEQSVNITYIKKVMFLAGTPTVEVSVSDGKFFLIDPSSFSSAQQETINSKDYYDINQINASTITAQGSLYDGTNYVYCIWIGTYSDTAGQYTDAFSIGSQSYEIGADFYNEDEVLTSNLENMGIEIPETVQKAIYESDVHNEATDNILMNRKWKELLLEYWNIVARKGSYKSLVDSLKWFEYGDLVKILEYWKRTDGGRKTLISNDLEQIVSDLFRKQLSVLSKTTYIGLYLALEQPSRTQMDDSELPFFMSNEVWSDPQEGQTAYSGGPRMFQENNPVLQQIASIWSAIDLSLKMTLVGNFYATYFMPVHLDLIHSTIENIIFTNTIKLLHHGTVAREDWIDLGGSFLCDTVVDGSNWYIQPVECNVGPLTILGIKDFSVEGAFDGTTEIISEHDSAIIERDLDMERAGTENDTKTIKKLKDLDEFPSVLGYTPDMTSMYGRPSVREMDEPGPDPVSYEGSIGYEDFAELLFLTNNIYTAYGAPVHFNVKIRQNVRSFDFLNRVSINWLRNGKKKFGYVDNGIYEFPKTTEDGKLEYAFDFWLLLQQEGSYELSIVFQSACGFTYTKRFKINVLDDADDHIDIYKITRMDYREWSELDMDLKADGDLQELVLISPGSDGPDIEWNANEFYNSLVKDPLDFTYSQFIHAANTNFSDTVGLNHVIMYPDYDGEPKVMSNDFTLKSPLGSARGSDLFNLAHLRANFPNYWWMKKEKVDIWLEPTATINEPEHDVLFHDGKIKPSRSSVIIGIKKDFSADPGTTSVRILAEKRYERRGGGIYNVKVRQSGNFIIASVNNTDVTTITAKDATKIDVPISGPDFKHTITIDIFPDPTKAVTVLPEEESTRIEYEGTCSRLVFEDRFIPMFHRLTPITSDNWLLRPGDTAVAVPHFGITEAGKYPDEVIMSFRHCGTQDTTDVIVGRSALDNPGQDPDFQVIGMDIKAPVGSQGLLIGHFTESYLKHGYYDVSVRYKFGGKWHTEEAKGAFCVADFTPTFGGRDRTRYYRRESLHDNGGVRQVNNTVSYRV